MFMNANAWYTYDGSENDIILSSRVRIARNISGARFPALLTKDDAEEVYTDIAAAFQNLSTSAAFHAIRYDTMDAIAKKIFEERSILPAEVDPGYAKGVVIRDDGILSATVNIKDHLRVATFYAGFEIQRCFSLTKRIVGHLGETIDFCAVENFGYLSSDIKNIGSGIKSSILCSLPGYSLTDRIKKKIEELTKDNFEVFAYYAQNTKKLLGYLYLISTKTALGGNDELQINHIMTTVRSLIEEERELRQSLLHNQLWRIQDMVVKAFCLAKYAQLLDVKETIELLFKIKLGINLGLIEGLSNETCVSLLYQTQTAHIAFLLLNGTVEFDEAFPLDELRIERIRALLVHDALKTAELRVQNSLKLNL